MSTVKPDAKQDRPAAEVRFFFVVLLLSSIAFCYVLRDFATDLVFGFLIAGASRGLYERLIPRLWGRPWASALTVTVIVAVVIAVPLGYLASALSREAAHAYEAALHSLSMSQVQDALAGEGGVGKQVQRLAKGLGVETSPEAVRRALSQAASKAASWITPQLNALVTNVFALLYHFAMMLIVVFYGLVDGPALKRRVFTLSPLPDEEEQRIIEKFRDVWSAVMVGNGVGSLLQGALGGLAMWAVGLPSPLLWSVVMTVFAFLPLVGISVVVVPATIYLVLVERFAAAAMFFGFCNVQGLLIENVVKTKLMGDRMQMHSLLIFLAVLGGIGTFGLAGVLYGPLIATFFVTIVDLYERVYRQRFFPDP